MKISNNSVSDTVPTQPASMQNTAKQEEILIGDYMVPKDVEGNETIAHSSNTLVALDNEKTQSPMMGFTKQEITVTTPGKQSFKITLHVQANTDPEMVQVFSQKIIKAISNMPPEVLNDMKEELQHITICPNIIVNKKAKALAVGQLNQIFLSAEKMSTLSEQQIAETLIHEQGHLIDEMPGGFFKGKGTKFHEKNFNKLKEAITPELGFDTTTHSLEKVSELFADYYLYKFGQPSDTHRCKPLFDKLENYNNDVKNLSEEELTAKYGNETPKIKELSQKWNTLKSNFEYFLRNVQSGEYQRMAETQKPRSIEDMT